MTVSHKLVGIARVRDPWSVPWDRLTVPEGAPEPATPPESGRGISASFHVTASDAAWTPVKASAAGVHRFIGPVTDTGVTLSVSDPAGLYVIKPRTLARPTPLVPAPFSQVVYGEFDAFPTPRAPRPLQGSWLTGQVLEDEEPATGSVRVCAAYIASTARLFSTLVPWVPLAADGSFLAVVVGGLRTLPSYIPEGESESVAATTYAVLRLEASDGREIASVTGVTTDGTVLPATHVDIRVPLDHTPHVVITLSST